MSLIAQVSQAAKFSCENLSGSSLEIETKEKMISAHWYGYKKYNKVPTLIAHFTGTHASKVDQNTVFYHAKDMLSDLYVSIELEKYSKTVLKFPKKACNRAGCDHYPIPVTQYKATLHLSNTRYPHAFTCKKLN